MSNLQPLLSRDRYTDEEWEYASSGRCAQEIEIDWHGITRCGKPSSPESFYRFCEQHDEDAREYPTYGK